jgi:O-antigen/teichoic acid export membrane protein
MPFTVRHLGQTEYGLWMLVASMTTYFQLLDLGYGNGIVRQLVDADRRGDTADVNRIASTFVCVYAGIALVACAAIAVMVVVVVPRFPHLSPAQVRLAQLLLAMLGARVAIGFPLTVFGAVTNARQGFVLNNLVATATVVASAATTCAVLTRRRPADAGGGDDRRQSPWIRRLCVDRLPRDAPVADSAVVFQRVTMARGDELQSVLVRHQSGRPDQLQPR